ncbi:deoxynucleoside kinase, partial [Candidatus Neomarinimicrobiota bacterium]
DKEMTLYNRIASLLERDIANPDLIVYLQSDTDRLMANIKKRSRSYEVNMDWKYLDALNQLYNEFFFRYQQGPLLIINSNDLDFVNQPEDFEEIVRCIREPIIGTRFFNPGQSE